VNGGILAGVLSSISIATIGVVGIGTLSTRQFAELAYGCEFNFLLLIFSWIRVMSIS